MHTSMGNPEDAAQECRTLQAAIFNTEKPNHNISNITNCKMYKLINIKSQAEWPDCPSQQPFVFIDVNVISCQPNFNPRSKVVTHGGGGHTSIFGGALPPPRPQPDDAADNKALRSFNISLFLAVRRFWR